MNIDKMYSYQVGGVSPEINIMKKINELIDEINQLKKRINELESANANPNELN